FLVFASQPGECPVRDGEEAARAGARAVQPGGPYGRATGCCVNGFFPIGPPPVPSAGRRRFDPREGQAAKWFVPQIRVGLPSSARRLLWECGTWTLPGSWPEDTGHVRPRSAVPPDLSARVPRSGTPTRRLAHRGRSPAATRTPGPAAARRPRALERRGWSPR